MKAQLNKDVFKKPFSPTKHTKKVFKPENLTYWSDDQHKFGMYCSCLINR